MPKDGIIRADFEKLKKSYPTYKTLPAQLTKFMDGLNKNIPPGGPRSTPCCVQVSHALNSAGEIVPPRSSQRGNSWVQGFFYILNVKELEDHLVARYGDPVIVKDETKGKDARTLRQLKDSAALKDRQGILLFRDSGLGFHTELWDKTRILQDGNAVSGGGAIMNEAAIFRKPRVLFWPVDNSGEAAMQAVPDWLSGWWDVNDGNQYYYYFSAPNMVLYTKRKPLNLKAPPERTPANDGEFTVSNHNAVVAIDWNPADGGATKETFVRAATTIGMMQGTSNRYAPLMARKMS